MRSAMIPSGTQKIAKQVRQEELIAPEWDDMQGFRISVDPSERNPVY